MTYETLHVEKEGMVDWLTLSRPEVLNALNDVMMNELDDYFGRLTTDSSVRIVAMRGAGRAFCAGWDVKNQESGAQSGKSRGPENAYQAARQASEIVRKMRRCPQPIVAMINGAACGGGFALAAAADIRIAVPLARMNAAFIRIGLSGCDMGLSYHLPRIIGTAVAAELMLTGRFINAQRALAVGLVSEIVGDEDLIGTARSYIDEMLATSPLGLRLTKECMNMNLAAGSLESAIAMEDRNQTLCLQSPEFNERLQALGERKS